MNECRVSLSELPLFSSSSSPFSFRLVLSLVLSIPILTPFSDRFTSYHDFVWVYFEGHARDLLRGSPEYMNLLLSILVSPSCPVERFFISIHPFATVFFFFYSPKNTTIWIGQGTREWGKKMDRHKRIVVRFFLLPFSHASENLRTFIFLCRL